MPTLTVRGRIPEPAPKQAIAKHPIIHVARTIFFTSRPPSSRLPDGGPRELGTEVTPSAEAISKELSEHS